ncbi:hypothetical protein P7C73_g6517, partial [Tremellales sp. Uapishka_1]
VNTMSGRNLLPLFPAHLVSRGTMNPLLFQDPSSQAGHQGIYLPGPITTANQRGWNDGMGRLPPWHADQGPPGPVPFVLGDWNCVQKFCGYHNFQRNSECRACGHPRFGDQNAAGKAPGKLPPLPTVPATSHNGPPLGAAGDWQCECGFINWRRRSMCKSCHPNHPGNQDRPPQQQAQGQLPITPPTAFVSSQNLEQTQNQHPNGHQSPNQGLPPPVPPRPRVASPPITPPRMDIWQRGDWELDWGRGVAGWNGGGAGGFGVIGSGRRGGSQDGMRGAGGSGRGNGGSAERVGRPVHDNRHQQYPDLT